MLASNKKDTSSPKIDQNTPLSLEKLKQDANNFTSMLNQTLIKEFFTQQKQEDLFLLVRCYHEKLDQINRKSVIDLIEQENLDQFVQKFAVDLCKQSLLNVKDQKITKETINAFMKNITDTLHKHKQERLVTEHPTDCNKKTYTNIRNAQFYLEMVLFDLKSKILDTGFEPSDREYAVIRQNIIIILDNLKKDPSLYHNKEEVQKYINTLNYHLRNFSGKNDYKIAEVIDMLSKAIDTIENLKIECLIPVENQKRSPDIESHRMMEFLKEDGYNSQVLFEAIKTNVANFIKANSKGLKSSEILKNLNTLSHTMFIKTGTWAGDSAGKPRVTGDTIHKSYIENVENVIKNVINVIENGFNDVPSSIYMPGLRNLLDERIKNTQDPVDKATLNKIKTIVRNIVTSLEGIQTASQKNTSMHLSKHKLLQKFDVLWSSDTYLQVLDKYEDIASALLRTQSWISNNFHVNIYERTDAQVNQDAVNDLFKTFKKKTKSPLLNILKDKEFSDLTEDEKFTLLNNIMDLNSKEGQRIISLLNNEFHEILEHLNLDQTHPDYSSTVITELKRNRVVANGGYVEHLINDGQNIYTEYNSIYKSMIADTEKPSDVLSKMLLMRICSNNPKEPPKAHIIPLTENMEFFQTIKKTPKPPRKGKEENKPGLVHKLYTCDSYMQMLAMMGFKMTKMTAQSDTPRHNGVIGALHGIDYAIEKLKQVACHPDVMACIAKNSKFAISTTKDIKDYKSLETPRSYPKTVEISIKNGKGHNIMRNGGTALNYTVQGHNHTYANQAYQYMWNVISTWNNNLYPDTKYKDLVQTNEEIKKVYKIAKKFPNASSEAHRYRFFDNKQDDNFIEKALKRNLNPLIGEAKINLPDTLKFQAAFNKAARGEKNEKGDQSSEHPVLFTKDEAKKLQNLDNILIKTLFTSTRAISADLKTRHSGLYDNLTGSAVMQTIRDVFECEISEIPESKLKQVFILNTGLFGALWRITIGFYEVDLEGFLKFFPKQIREKAFKESQCMHTIKQYTENNYDIKYDKNKFKAIKQGEEIEINITPYDIIAYEIMKAEQKSKDLNDLKYILKSVFGDRFKDDSLLSFMSEKEQKFYAEKLPINKAIRKIYGYINRKHFKGIDDSELFPSDWIDENGKNADKLTNLMMSLLDGLDRADNLHATHLCAHGGSLERTRVGLCLEIYQDIAHKLTETVSQGYAVGF